VVEEDVDPSASARASRAGRLAAVLRVALDLAARVERGCVVLATAAAVSAAGAWLTWIATDAPTGRDRWMARLVVLALLLVPPAVLAVFVAGLRELRALPARIRELPPDVRRHAADLRVRSRRGRERRGLLGMLGALVRLGRLVLGSRELLSPWAVVATALRPTVLIAAMLAAVAAIVEVPASLLTVLVLLLAP
jgi:hypothetical protein